MIMQFVKLLHPFTENRKNNQYYTNFYYIVLC